MQFFEKKFSLFLLLFSIPLLFLPKINLVSFGGETAGLRIDDFILFILASLLMWSHIKRHQQLCNIEKWILLLTAFSLLSFLSNRLLVASNMVILDAKIFYVFRLFEYFIFFYIGALAAHHFNGSGIVRAFFLWNIGLMLLQKFNLAGALTVGGYTQDASSRVQGIASFPSEMGLLLNLLFCYMVWSDSAKSQFVNLFSKPHVRDFLRQFYLYWMFLLIGLFVVFTGNRISIAALMVCFLFRLKKEFHFRSINSTLLIILFLPFLITTVGLAVKKTASVYERSADLFSFKNLKLAEVVWDKIDMTKDPLEGEAVSSQNYDMSWWIRIHKWTYVMKVYVSTPEAWLQGLGPGFAWSALDGGMLRILIEYGLIGAFLFWKFFCCLYRINSQVKWMMVAFSMNMIFFDAYLAYKTMSFLLFASGYIFEHKRGTAKALEEKTIEDAAKNIPATV